MEVCTVAIEMVLTGKTLTAYELPIFSMMNVTWKYNRYLGKRAVPLSPAFIYESVSSSVDPTSTSKQYTNQLFIHPSIHILPTFLTPFGRNSVSQATDETAGKDSNTNSLILNTFLHPQAVSNC